MTPITKENSQTRIEFTKDANGKILAAKVSGYGHDQVYICGKWFKTEAGARKWAAKQLA